jgi:CheY-like chemotaxis protein
MVGRLFDERFPGYLSRTVFMTGGAFTEKTRAFAESMANPVLTKPFELEDIADIIKAHQPAAERQSA